MRYELDYFPADYTKACHALHLVKVLGWSQTKTAIFLCLNVGTVNHIIHGKRFSTAVPIPPNHTTFH